MKISSHMTSQLLQTFFGRDYVYMYIMYKEFAYSVPSFVWQWYSGCSFYIFFSNACFAMSQYLVWIMDHVCNSCQELLWIIHTCLKICNRVNMPYRYSRTRDEYWNTKRRQTIESQTNLCTNSSSHVICDGQMGKVDRKFHEEEPRASNRIIDKSIELRCINFSYMHAQQNLNQPIPESENSHFPRGLLGRYWHSDIDKSETWVELS